MPKPPQLSHIRFWGLLTAFLFVNLLIGRFFGWVVGALGLDNSTRALYREVAETGAGPVLGNLLLNWIPQLLLVSLSCRLYLRLARVDVRAALTFRLQGNRVWLLPLGLLVLLVYQLIARSVVGVGPLGDAVAFDRHSLAFVALYTVRFLPSAMIEELVFRGCVFTSTRNRYGTATGFVVSVLLFGLAHLYGGWWLFVNALLLGCGFTVVYALTRSLAPVTLLHLFSNVAYAYLHYRS